MVGVFLVQVVCDNGWHAYSCYLFLAGPELLISRVLFGSAMFAVFISPLWCNDELFVVRLLDVLIMMAKQASSSREQPMTPSQLPHLMSVGLLSEYLNQTAVSLWIMWHICSMSRPFQLSGVRLRIDIVFNQNPNILCKRSSATWKEKSSWAPLRFLERNGINLNILTLELKGFTFVSF